MAEERVDLTLDARQALAQIAQFEARLERAGNVTLNVDTRGINRAVGETETALRRAGAAGAGITDPRRTAAVATNFDKARTSVDKTTASLKKGAVESEKVRKSTLGIGTALSSIAGLVIVQRGFQFFKQAATDASALGESLNVINTLFGDAAGEVTRFAAGASAIGQSTIAAQEAAGSFGNLLINMGLARGESATFGIELTKLASDLASFRNADPAEVVEALGAALRGEAEPARRFGIFLDEQAVAARAVKLELAEGVGSVDNFAKAQARLSLIFEQTKDAQDDFLRTAGTSLPNQMRILKAEFENVRTEVGEALLPALMRGVQVIRAEFLPAVRSAGTDLAGSLGEAIPAVVDAGVSLLEVLPTMAELISNVTRVTTPLFEVLSKIPPELLSMAVTAFAVTKRLGQEGSGLGAVMKKLGGSTGSIGLVTAELALFQIALSAVSAASDKTSQALAETLNQVATGQVTLDQALAEGAKALQDAEPGDALTGFGEALEGSKVSAEELTSVFGSLNAAQRALARGLTTRELEKLSDELLLTGESASGLGGLFGELTGHADDVRLDQAREQSEALREGLIADFEEIAKGAGLLAPTIQELFSLSNLNPLTASENLGFLTTAMDAFGISTEAVNDAFEVQTVKIGDLTLQVPVFSDIREFTEAARREQERMNTELETQERFLRAVADTAEEKFGPTLAQLAEDAAALSAGIEGANTQLDRMRGEVSRTEAFINFQTELRETFDLLKSEDFVRGITQGTDAAEANFTQFIELAESAEARILEAVERGASPPEIAELIDTSTEKIRNLGNELGVTTGVVEDYADSYGLIPTLVRTHAELDKEPAKRNIESLREDMRTLGKAAANPEVSIAGRTEFRADALEILKFLNDLDRVDAQVSLRLTSQGGAFFQGFERFQQGREGAVITSPTLIAEVPGYADFETVFNPRSSHHRIERLMHEGRLYPKMEEIVLKNLSSGPTAGAIGSAVGSSLRGGNRDIVDRLDELVRLQRRGPKPRPL